MWPTNHAGKLSVVAFLVFVGVLTARAQNEPIELVRPGFGNSISTPSIADDGAALLVAGNKSDSVVRFDLVTGKATVVAKLASGSRPWSLAVSPAGEIFVGLRGGKKNIVRLVPGLAGDPTGPLVAVDLTGAIGRFGPGLMAFDQRGLLNVAGDTHRAVLRYDVTTGELVESLRLRDANLVGLTLAGDALFAAEYFQQTILRFDLAADPVVGEKLIYKSEHLDRAHGMTAGHNGNLFVSNLQNSLIQEFSSETGQFVKTFLDVRTLGGGNVKDLHFEPRVGKYFLSSGDVVYQLSTDGAMLAKYENAALSGAVAIAIQVSAPSSAVAHSITDSGTADGLIGYATVRGAHVPVALRYQHGKVFQPASLVGTVTEAGQTPRDLKLVFRGRLHIAKQTAVKAFVTGGSSNGGHCWLRMDDLDVGPLGDDHKKNATREITLDAGDHAIEWTLTGGDFGCGLLKFIDAETSQLLPLTFTRADEIDMAVNKTIRVSSDQPGWPVIAEWIDTTTKAWDSTADGPPPEFSTGQTVVDRLRDLGATIRIESGNVVELNLTDSAIRDADMELVSSLTTLKHLSLNGCRNLTDDGLAYLRPLSGLQGLALERTRITDVGMNHLEGLTELGFLSLNWTSIGDGGLKHLSGLTKLGVLYLCATRTADAGIGSMRDMKQLSWLDLRETQVTDTGLDHLVQLPKLRLLCLYGDQITDAGSVPLSKLTNVEQLTLSHTRVTDAALLQLIKLPKLNDLGLHGTRVTEHGVRQFQQARPDCKVGVDGETSAVTPLKTLLE